MRRFELIEPDSIDGAIAALQDVPEAKVIAGGTALLILIKHGIYLPTTMVNLKKVRGGAEISYGPERGLRIGALATIHEVERHPVVRERYPVLAEACHVVANSRIRNLATIGGNVAHADYQSDPPAVLVALGARLELQGPNGIREIGLSDFLLAAYETALGTAEIVTAVTLPPNDADWRGVYIKFTTRSSEDRPAVGMTLLASVANGVCTDARLVVGALTPVPTRVVEAEDALRGHRIDAPRPAIAPLVERSIDPIDDIRGSASYKRRVAGVLAERALARLATQGAVQ